MAFYKRFQKKHLIAAHRGFKYQENTIPAFLYAKSRCDFIEFDVRECKDEIVVFHDKDLKRLFNKNELIKNLPYKRLKKYFIPSLKEVLEVLDDFPVNVEIKPQNHDKQMFLKKLTEILKYKQNLIVSSFDFEYLKNLPFNKAILLDKNIPLPDDFEYEAIHFSKEINLPKTSKTLGVFTINKNDEMDKFFKSGVRVIFTDNWKL